MLWLVTMGVGVRLLPVFVAHTNDNMIARHIFSDPRPEILTKNE